MNTTFLRIAVFLSLLLPSAALPAPSQPVKLSVAVFNLQAQGIGQAFANIVSERLRSELANTGVFYVVGLSEMESMEHEQGFQLTDHCETVSCFAEAGGFLGVDRVITGSLGNADDLYTLTLQVIRGATGEVLSTVSEDYRGDMKDLLSSCVTKAAQKCALGAGKTVLNSLLSGKTGDLFIDADRPGAGVEIDGRVVAGETPLALRGVSCGTHHIIVRKDAWFGSKTVELTADAPLSEKIAMQQGSDTMGFISEPAGAEVFVDDKQAGQTPIHTYVCPAGEHEVRFEKAGYVTKTAATTPAADGTQTVSVRLVAAAFVSVGVEPSFALIVINGDIAGRGTVDRLQVPAGPVAVRCEAPGYDIYKKDTVVSGGDTLALSQTLGSSFGTLQVGSDPGGCRLFLNNQRAGATPYRNRKMKPGTYPLGLILDSPYARLDDTVSVVKNGIVQKNYSLVSSRERVVPPEKKKKRFFNPSRIVFSSLTVACFATGVYFNSRVNKRYQDFLNYQGGSESVNDDYWQKVEDMKAYRNFSYVLATLSALGLVVSFSF
jgi:hypothetical protein